MKVWGSSSEKMKNSWWSGRSDWTRGGHASRRRRAGKRRAGATGGGALVPISRNAELSNGSDFGGQTPPSARLFFSSAKPTLVSHLAALT